MRVRKFGEEIFENHLNDELRRSGFSDLEIDEMTKLSKETKLGQYMIENGSQFTFGILNAIYLDIEANKFKTDIFKNIFKSFYRIIPGVVALTLPIVGVVGMTLSVVRGTNRVITPIIENPGKTYPDFLKKFLTVLTNVVDGELPIDDPLRKAFLLSDNIIKIIKPDIIHQFIYYLSDKMSKEDPLSVVPDNYIEMEFRLWVEENYQIRID